jgi:acyl carrier protein
MARILDALRDIRPEEDFRASENWIDDGLLDSFDIMMLVSAMDKAYGVSILGTDIVPENFRNLEAIEALLRKHGVEP